MHNSSSDASGHGLHPDLQPRAAAAACDCGVLEQTFGDLRLVVSDNASTDETPDVVASFDDPRLEYVRQPENLGLLGNHNWFLERVDTDYALILPDDDLVYPDLLERTVAELDRRRERGWCMPPST